VIESVDLESDGRGGEVLIAQVQPKAGVACRCSRCGLRCVGYDSSATPPAVPSCTRWGFR
jgi:hypothetical protein